MISTDVAIIGGGIVGLATAYQLTRELPGPAVVVLEKEAELALHQTGHNSGVLHSGIYYKPGSLKAINCRQGKKLMEEFCAAEGIAYEICGKVIVALDESELPAMERIFERGQANGVDCEVIGTRAARRTRAALGRHQGDPRSRGGHRQLQARSASAWPSASASATARCSRRRG